MMMMVVMVKVEVEVLKRWLAAHDMIVEGRRCQGWIAVLGFVG